jgi:hypothetical protein
VTTVRRAPRAIRHPVLQNALAMQATQAATLIVPLVEAICVVTVSSRHGAKTSA